MTNSDKRWVVPTAREMEAQGQDPPYHARGPLAWVRKLSLKAGIGTHCRTAPPSADPGSSRQGQPRPPIGGTVPPVPGVGDRSTHVNRLLAPPPPAGPVTPDGVENGGAATPAPVGSAPTRGRIQINEKALKKRTGGAEPRTVPAAGVRQLISSGGWGRCSLCGREFHGPVLDNFSAHICGERPQPYEECW